MKKILLCGICLAMLCSCRLLHFGRGEGKSGCPMANSNVGAERILAGDAKAIKASEKAARRANKKMGTGL